MSLDEASPVLRREGKRNDSGETVYARNIYENTENDRSYYTETENSVDNVSSRKSPSPTRYSSSPRDRRRNVSPKVLAESLPSAKAEEDNGKARTVNRYVKRNNSSNVLTNSIFLLILIAPAILYVYGFRGSHESMQNEREENRRDTVNKFRESVKEIRLKFKNQKLALWNEFLSQVEEIINDSTQVSMIILLGNETNTVTCLARLLGGVSSKALGSDNYLTLNARNIGNEHGEIINKLKAQMRLNKVMVMEDLLATSSEAIKAFHNLCDKENPLISKAVYIMTVVSSDYDGSHEDKFLENCLTKTFSKKIELDVLDPLITRIMDGPVISVSPEPNMEQKESYEKCLLF